MTYGLSASEKPAYLSISGSTLVATDVEVQEEHEKTYTVSVFAYNQYGRAEGSFNITVIAIPEWDVIPTQTVYEDVAINFDVSQYHNRTRIDTYGITVTASTTPPGAPSLPLMISANGRITAPAVTNFNDSYTYVIEVSAMNTAGDESTRFILRLVEQPPEWRSANTEFTVEEGEPFQIGLASYVVDPLTPDQFGLTRQNRARGELGTETSVGSIGLALSSSAIVGRTDNYNSSGEKQTGDDGLAVSMLVVPATSMNPQLQFTGGVAPYVIEDQTFYAVARAANTADEQPSTNFKINVTAAVPIWTSAAWPQESVDEQDDIRVQIRILSDITNYVKAFSNNEPIQLRLRADARLGLTIDNSGLILGTAPGVNPPYQDFEVLVRVRNEASKGRWFGKPFTIRVAHVDSPPTIGVGLSRARWRAGPIVEVVTEGEAFNIDLSVYVVGNPASWQLNANRRIASTSDPELTPLRISNLNGLRISSAGLITGNGTLLNAPNVQFDEIYRITATIVSGISPTDSSKDFDLVIRQKPPKWNDVSIPNANEQSLFSVDISPFCQEEPERFSLDGIAGNNPESPALTASLNPSTGVISGETPDLDQDSSYTMTVSGYNNAGSDQTAFNLLVQQTVPIWNTIPSQEVNEARENVIINLISFVDNDPDDYQVVSVTPSGLSVSRFGASSIRFNTPIVSQDTAYTVLLSASNSAGTSLTNGSLVITVKNLLPEWSKTTTFQMNEGTTESFNVLPYVSLLHDEATDLTFSLGTPRLQNASTHSAAPPTLTVTQPSNAASNRGTFSATASSVGLDAYYDVPAVVTNSAGSASQNFIIHVANTITAPVFDACEDQEIREGTSLDFTINATSEFTVTYSQVSGPSWAAPNSRTGYVGGTAPPVMADTEFTVVYRASATNTQGTADTADDITETADCTITITVLDYTAPPAGTGPSWDTIPDRYYVERARFSFNIASYVSGNPTPTLGERTGAGTPEFVRISSAGQVSGDGPSVGSVATQATNDGKIWKITLSAGRTLSASQVSFVSGVLATDNRLEAVVAGGQNTIHYLVFSSAVSSMLRSAIRIAGSPSVSVRNLEKSWYNTFTVYATAFNIVSSTIRTAHTTFQMFFINTDDTLPTALQAPTLNVPNQNIDEGDTLSLDLTEYTTGTNTAENPITYERSLRTETSRFSLPDWENLGTGGSGVFLSSAGMLTGVAPEIDGDVENTVYVTARNSVGVGGDRFTITILDDAVIGHREPVWEIGNKRYVATQDTADIDPIRDGEVEGTPPITITLTDATANPLPSWLTLSNNVLSGSPALSDVGVSTIALTATNTNTRGTSYSSAVTFTVTVVAPPGPTDPHVAPVWNISPLSVDEGEIVTIDPLTDDQLTGTPPITITVTDATATPLPSWLPLSNNILRGTAVAAGSPFTVALTATNTDASNVDYTATTSFTITVTPSTQPHSPPSWSIDNLSYEEDVQVTIAPIVDETLTGSSPLTISLTDGMTMPLPPWLSLSGNVLRGRTPTGLTTDQISTIALRGSNTDTTGTVHTSDTTFTITVTAGEPPDDPDCIPPLVRGIRRQIVYTGETTTLDITGYIREGNPVPNVRDDPDYHTLPFVTSPNHGRGFIQITVPGRRSDYTPLLGRHEQFIIIENACGSVKRSFFITVEQARFIPPVIGDLPNVTLEDGDTYSDDLNQYITSTHASEFPRWRKQQVDPAADESGWQNADWWTVGEHGGLSITGQPVNRDTTNTLSVEAYNPDGLDTGHFELTFPYVPRPPYCDPEPIPMQEVNEGERISFRIDQYIKETFTTIRIDSVEKVNSASPELFLKSINSPAYLVGTISGSNNASNSGAVGTKALAAVGSAPDVDTESAPTNLVADHDYTVTITVINTGLVTTPRYPSNSSQCTFTFRINDLVEPPEAPEWVEIPLQTSVEGQSISMSLSQYARKSPTGYSIVSTTHASGNNPGAIILVASSTGVVTRQGGAVAPEVSTQALYNVVIRANNAGGSADQQFSWRIIDIPETIVGAPAFSTVESSDGFSPNILSEYNPETGMRVAGTTITDSGGGVIWIEGVGSTIYALHAAGGSFGTITYDGASANYNSTGTVRNPGGSSWRGLTSIGSLLYSIGSSLGIWKLYSIDPSTRVATAVNAAATANNLGLSGSGFVPGGITSSGSTIYALVRNRTNYCQLVSIPTTGTNRGIATAIGSEFSVTSVSYPYGTEIFNGTLQAFIPDSGGDNDIVDVINFNISTGARTTLRDRAGTRWKGLTQYAVAKPVMSQIPVQRVQEGQPINFPIASYVTGATGYSLGTLTAVTTAAPLFPLQINASGTITGTTGNENAPLVTANSYYSLLVFASNSAGRVFQSVTIAVLNSPPIWRAVPPQFINEGDPIRFSVAPYVGNQPTSFRLGAITKPRPEAPNIFLQINASGNVQGVGATVNAPEVDMDERYDVVITAENAAGSRSTTVALTIVDLGNIGDQVPFVRRWDVPEDPQPGSFDILVDFNIPVYGLSPQSFVFEGVELRGDPFLLWSPIPSSDIPENRPTAEQRNLDYLTTPIPVRGTKYFKLSFPTSILPDVLDREKLLNIYVTANAARGGQV